MFTIDLSQGDQRQMMQQTSMAVMNRKIDSDIITVLDTATIGTTVAQEANVNTVQRAIAELGNNNVKVEDEDAMFGLVTPAFYAALSQAAEWSSSDYVDQKWFANRNSRLIRWNGINWIRHSGLTGLGTASEKCYIYHKDAIGHAMDKSRVESVPGTNTEQHYDYVRTTGFFGSIMLENSAIVQILHKGDAYNLS